MTAQEPRMNIDLDRRCSKCGDNGLVNETGLCLKCIRKQIPKMARRLRLEAAKGATEMAKRNPGSVEINGTIKKVSIATKYTEGGEPRPVTQVVFETDAYAGEFIGKLYNLQGEELTAQIEKKQLELPKAS